MSDQLFIEAVGLAHRGRWSEAALVFARYVGVAGEDAEVLLLWGGCLAELGRHTEALPLLERAERLCARSPQRRSLRVRALGALGQCARHAGQSGQPGARQGMRRQALAAYRAAAALAPGDRDLEACVRQLEESMVDSGEIDATKSPSAGAPMPSTRSTPREAGASD